MKKFGRNVKYLYLLFPFLLFFSLLGHADVKLKGEISGVVVEESGESLPGAMVTLTGKNLFQKELSLVSDAKGSFRFLNLNPGIYQIDFSLNGFSKLRLDKIEVRVGQSNALRAVLTPAKMQSEVTIVAAAPLIDTKVTQLSTNFNAETIKNIPTSRKILDLMNATPAVNDNGAYGSGGETHESGSSEYPRGSATSAFRLNGVEVSDPEFGDVWVNPSYETIEEVQVIGVGASAEYGNFTGATLNVVTKSGANAFQGGLNVYYSGKGFYGDNSNGIIDLKTDVIKNDLDLSASIGGPLIKEKLFFYLVGGYTGLVSKEYGAPSYSNKKQAHGYAKLDWALDKNNTLSMMFNADPLKHDNLGLNAVDGPEIGYGTIFNTTSWLANWQTILGSDTFISAKYAGYRGRYEYNPVSLDEPVFWDDTTGRQYGSFGRIIGWYRTRHEIDASLTRYADDFLKSSHEFKFGVEYEKSGITNQDRMAGGGYFFAYPYDAYNVAVWAGTGGVQDAKSYIDRFSAFAQDNVKIGSRISLNLGVRFDAPRLKARGLSKKVVSFSDISPRFGLSYDFGGGKSVLHLHYGRYSDKMSAGGWYNAVPGTTDRYSYFMLFPGKFDYTEENRAAVLQPENLVGVQTSSQPLPVESGLHSPHTDVLNLGFEQQLGKDFALSINYIYKRDRGMIVVSSTTPHVYEQIQWTDPYFGKTLSLWQQMDTNPDNLYYTNSKNGKRRHHIVVLNLRKRMTGNWSMQTSFTYQNSQGNIDNTQDETGWFGDFNRDNDPNFDEKKNPLIWGPLTYNRPLQLKTFLTYRMPWGILLSGNFTIMSGRSWAADTRSYRAGINRTAVWSFNLLLEKAGSRRLPTDKYFDLRLSKSFDLGGSKIELIGDILNAFNNRAGMYFYTEPWDVYPISQQPAFGKPLALRQPRHSRLAIRWSF